MKVSEVTRIMQNLLSEMIKHQGGKWSVYDHTGTKKLGTHSTKKEALSQLRAIEAQKHVRNEEHIPGGLTKGKTVRDIAEKYAGKYYTAEDLLPTVHKALDAGIKVEMEHTTNKAYAREIAMDHLWEDLKYYIKLKKIE